MHNRGQRPYFCISHFPFRPSFTGRPADRDALRRGGCASAELRYNKQQITDCAVISRKTMPTRRKIGDSDRISVSLISPSALLLPGVPPTGMHCVGAAARAQNCATTSSKSPIARSFPVEPSRRQDFQLQGQPALVIEVCQQCLIADPGYRGIGPGVIAPGLNIAEVLPGLALVL